MNKNIHNSYNLNSSTSSARQKIRNQDMSSPMLKHGQESNTYVAKDQNINSPALITNIETDTSVMPTDHK